MKVFSQHCSEFNADYKTVIVFVLALIVFYFASFELPKKKKHENHNFLKNYIENSQEQKVIFF